MFHRSTTALLLAAVLLGSIAGCGGRQPQVKVIGISQPRHAAAADTDAVVLFLEVVNPTRRDLRLARIEYRLAAESWFATRGAVDLSRAIAADSVAVVEIPIPVDGAVAASRAGKVPYQFEGRLFTIEERVERSWRVKVDGTLGPPLGATSGRIRGRVATAD